MMLHNLGETLAKFRHAAGLTQPEAADRIHISRQCLGNWETGTREPRFTDVVQLCQLYGIGLEQLLKV